MKLSRILAHSLPLFTCLVVAGCSSARMDSQWLDRSFHDGLAAGARVFVACETAVDSLRRLCEDAWTERMRAEGIAMVRSYGAATLPADAGNDPARIDDAARATGASAVVRMKLAQGSHAVFQPGPQVGFGIGGGSGGFSFGGIGVSLPIGGGGVSQRQEMSSSTTLTDLGRGTVIWAGSARTEVDGDAGAQVSALTRVTVEAMKEAGVIR